MKDGRENSWWIIVPKCLPLAMPTDLAAKAHDDGRYTIFLGTYVQAYDLCSGRRGVGGWPDVRNTTPASAVREITSGPPKRLAGPPDRSRSSPESKGPPDRSITRPSGPPVRFRPAGPPVRSRPAPPPVDEVIPDDAQIQRFRQRLAADGPPMPETIASVRADLARAIDRYEQARSAGEDMTYPRNRLLAGRAMLAAMEGM